MAEQVAYRSSIHPPESEYITFVTAEGEDAGDVAWLRTTGSEGNHFKGGMWRAKKSEGKGTPYLFAVDETFVMIEGVLRIELENGETLDFGPGDTGSFLKGTRSTWYVLEPVLHFFIQTDYSAK